MEDSTKVDLGGSDKSYVYLKCNYCDKVVKGDVTKMKEYLSGSHKNVAPCAKFYPKEPNVQAQAHARKKPRKAGNFYGANKTYYTGGYDPVVPPVAPPPDRIGATEALIRLSMLLRQSFVLKSRLCSPQKKKKKKKKEKRKRKRKLTLQSKEEGRSGFSSRERGRGVRRMARSRLGIANSRRRRALALANSRPKGGDGVGFGWLVQEKGRRGLFGWVFEPKKGGGASGGRSLSGGSREKEKRSRRAWSRLGIANRGERRRSLLGNREEYVNDGVERKFHLRTTVGTPLLTDGDPVGKVRESTTTVVTPHTNYGDPVGRATESAPTVVTPHTNYGDPVGRVRKGKPTAVTPHTNYGDPVGRVRDTVAPRKITLIAKSDFSTGGRTFPERNWISCTESNSSGDSFGSRVMACVASTRKGEMCSVGTTTEEGEEETGKVKVLATVDLACGGLLSTASELCTACLIIPLVLRESASCHSSPELRGSGITTGGTTDSSLDVVGVPTSITWGATPKAVNCAVIVAMALAISAICACNCNTVASVSTERGGPPCAEVEVGRNVLPGLRRSQERLQHRGCEQLWGDVAPAVKGPLAAEQAPAEPQKQPSPELLPQMQLNETGQEGQELLQESPGSAEQSQGERAWQKQKPGERKEREARPEHPSSSKRKEEGRPEHESPLPERQLEELLADGAEGPEPFYPKEPNVQAQAHARKKPRKAGNFYGANKTYYTGGYDPVVPPVAPPPDRIGATEALIRLSMLLRQSFVLKSRLCSPQKKKKKKKKEKRKRKRKLTLQSKEEGRSGFSSRERGRGVRRMARSRLGIANSRRRRALALANSRPKGGDGVGFGWLVQEKGRRGLFGWVFEPKKGGGASGGRSLSGGSREKEKRSRRAWSRLGIANRGERRRSLLGNREEYVNDGVERKFHLRTTVGTPLLTDGDPVGKVRESTTTVVTPHTNYGDPVGRATESAPTVVTPHTNYGDPVGRVRKGKPTAVTPHTNYGDPVGRVRDTVAPRKITLIAKSDFSTGGRTFPERNWISCTESNSSGDSFGSRVMARVASTRKGEMCSVGTTTEEGEEETGKVKVLATVDLACGGLLSTASELCTACLIIPLVLRESASCHSSPELRGSGITTGGTTDSSLDVVGVPTSITWGATPKAVNCAVIVAMALAISAICACNCNTVASVSTERGGPPCAEVEVGRNVLPGLRRSQERLQHRGCEQLWGDVAPAVKGPLAAEQAPAEPQKQPSPELLPQMQLSETGQEGQELLQESPGSAEQSQGERAWQKQKPGERKEREARPEHPSSSKRKEEGRPEHESPLPERQLEELLADGAEGPEPFYPKEPNVQAQAHARKKPRKAGNFYGANKKKKKKKKKKKEKRKRKRKLTLQSKEEGRSGFSSRERGRGVRRMARSRLGIANSRRRRALALANSRPKGGDGVGFGWLVQEKGRRGLFGWVFEPKKGGGASGGRSLSGGSREKEKRSRRAWSRLGIANRGERRRSLLGFANREGETESHRERRSWSANDPEVFAINRFMALFHRRGDSVSSGHLTPQPEVVHPKNQADFLVAIREFQPDPRDPASKLPPKFREGSGRHKPSIQRSDSIGLMELELSVSPWRKSQRMGFSLRKLQETKVNSFSSDAETGGPPEVKPGADLGMGNGSSTGAPNARGFFSQSLKRLFSIVKEN
ncbi:hypothetical protein M5K25_008319 [Dendrobium thyrsiflorum]|uniref:Uncharacterized protein n=1 Tax=Dendrobium thyrsiflorum TaxID=117978 RepID=A0ABD0VFE5_DENTH